MIERGAAIKGTTTESAEFLALLNGLGSIVDRYKEKFGSSGIVRLEAEQPVVHWVTDRESLALAVHRGEDGTPVYRRKSTPELWAMFAYYEPMFTIKALFTKRDSILLHNRVDRVCSELRILIKEYYTVLNET